MLGNEPGLLDFLQQLPLFFIVMFCGAGVALVVSLTVILAARRRKTSTPVVNTAQPQAASSIPLMSYTPTDMPDLNSLLRGGSEDAPARPKSGGAQTVELTDGGSAEAVELILIMRDITAGGLIVQMHEKVYRITADMSDSEFRQKMMSILKELAQTVGSASSSAAASTPAASRPSLTQPPQATLTSAPPATSAAFDLPKFSTESSVPMTRRELKQAANAPIPEINIASAIEAFLQHKLAASGAFRGRSLHVKPASDGGIRIQVDNTYYETVDEIVEDDVKVFLQETIAEWQSRQ